MQFVSMSVCSRFPFSRRKRFYALMRANRFFVVMVLAELERLPSTDVTQQDIYSMIDESIVRLASLALCVGAGFRPS